MARGQHYEHGADIGVPGFAASKFEAFEQARSQGLALQGRQTVLVGPSVFRRES